MLKTPTVLSIYNNVGDDRAQLKDNCIVLYNLIMFGWLDPNICKKIILRFDEGKTVTKRKFKKLEKSLQKLVDVGVENMGADLVITNIPTFALLRESDIVDAVSSSHISATLNRIKPMAIDKVIKMSDHTYVVYCVNRCDAKIVADKLNGVRLSGGDPMKLYTIKYPAACSKGYPAEYYWASSYIVLFTFICFTYLVMEQF
jgi:hypothetical protein